MAYPDVFFTMLNLFSSFTDDNMMPQAITLHDEFIIILSQYIIFPFWTRYLPSKQKTSDILPLIFSHTIEFIHLEPKHRK